MPTLDFVRDICDILKKQEIDYYIIAIQKNNKKKPTRADIFATISNEMSLSVLEEHIKELLQRIEKTSKNVDKKQKNKKQ